MERNTKKVVDFEVGDRSKATFLNIALRLEKRYNIEHLCTDDYKAYGYYKIAKHHHRTKSETCLVEAKNSSMRDMPARLNRRTKRVSKSLDMLRRSVLLWANRDRIYKINQLLGGAAKTPLAIFVTISLKWYGVRKYLFGEPIMIKITNLT